MLTLDNTRFRLNIVRNNRKVPAWLERTATANTVLPQEILLLIGNETEDYFLLKKEGRQPGGKG